MIYDYEGDVIDFDKVIHMKYRKTQLDGDEALTVCVRMIDKVMFELKAVLRYNHVKDEVTGEDKITTSDYPIQKLKRLVNVFKQYKNRKMIVDRRIIRDNNNETVHEEISYE